MSEQFKQDAESQGQEIDDDPLAELARIVAGEPELNPQPQTAVAEEIPDADTSLEADIEEQLMSEFSTDEAPVEEISVEQEVEAPSFVEDINSTVEQISSEEVAEPEAHYDPEPAAVYAEVEENLEPEVPAYVEAEAADPEIGFQNGLIDALEMEIGGGPEPEPIHQEPVHAPAQEPVLETTQLEETYQASVDEELLQDPGVEVEMQASNIQASLEQELTDHFESFDAPAEESMPIVDAPIASIEEDLGAAFTNEFEQIASQQSEEPVDAFPIEEPVAATMAEPVLQEAVQGDPSLEMDFETAFAEELEGVGVPEIQGWAETETEEANEAFTAAVSPEFADSEQVGFQADLDTMEQDPGHVGSVDEIAAVEAGTNVANDNGGGMKFAIAALVLALFAGAIAAGYGFLGGENPTIASGTPEIIKADADPVKVKPEDPGGVVPENQDNASYVDIGGENSAQVSQETLNSQTEEPLILNTGNTENIENTDVAEAPKSDDRLSSSEDSGATPNANNSSVLPKVVQTVVVKPDGTIIAKPTTPKPVETALNTVKIGDTVNVEPKPVATQVIKKPEAIDGAKSTLDIAVPVASPLPKPVVKPAPAKKVAAVPKPKKAAPAPTAKSEWVVQVSSQRTPAAAQSSFSTMRNKYSVLQGRAMSIQRAQVNGSTYYRVRVQTASRADANQLCTSLATAGGSCFVTR